MMARQEIFDKVAQHLVTQGRRATEMNGSPRCCYLTSGGLKCAVGCLIPPEKYSPVIEGRRAMSLVVPTGPLSGIVDPNDVFYLEALQAVHDSVSPLEWIPKLRKFAVEYGVQWDHLPALQLVPVQ